MASAENERLLAAVSEKLLGMEYHSNRIQQVTLSVTTPLRLSLTTLVGEDAWVTLSVGVCVVQKASHFMLWLYSVPVALIIR